MSENSKQAIRIVLGGYLAFVGIRLFKQAAFDHVGNMAFGMFFGAVFTVVGLIYAITAIKQNLASKKAELDLKYADPVEDTEDDESTDEVVADAEVVENVEETAKTVEETDTEDK